MTTTHWHGTRQVPGPVGDCCPDPRLPDCAFPGCPQTARPDQLMCIHHDHVQLSSTGSWTNDRHTEGGHG